MTALMRVLDMEEKLAEDTDGAYRNGVCELLRADVREVKRHIDSGLTPDEFQRTDRYLAALESAIAVVERVWQSEHGRI